MIPRSFDELHQLFGNKYLLCKVIATRSNELLANEAFVEWLKKENLDLFEYIIQEYEGGKLKVHADLDGGGNKS